MDLAFSMVDYAIFGIMLFISFGIGVYHATKNTKNNEEFCEAAKVGHNVLPGEREDGGSMTESRLKR